MYSNIMKTHIEQLQGHKFFLPTNPHFFSELILKKRENEINPTNRHTAISTKFTQFQRSIENT
jgi:hypothetical protein